MKTGLIFHIKRLTHIQPVQPDLMRIALLVPVIPRGNAWMVAQLRGQSVQALAGSTWANALAALPRLQRLLAEGPPSQGG